MCVDECKIKWIGKIHKGLIFALKKVECNNMYLAQSKNNIQI